MTDQWEVHYTYLGSPRKHIVTSENEITEEQAVALAKVQYPHIKTFTDAVRVWEHVPASLRELKLTMTQTVANFIVGLLFHPPTRLSFEAKDIPHLDAIQKKYRQITGLPAEFESGALTVAAGQKWSDEATIRFDSGLTTYFPLEEFSPVKPEKLGQVNSNELFWTLVRMGFRLGTHHDENLIWAHIPKQLQDRVPDEITG